MFNIFRKASALTEITQVFLREIPVFLKIWGKTVINN